MVWLRIIISAIMALYGAHMINKRKNLGKIRFDKDTKATILNDQLKILTNPNCLEEEFNQSKIYTLQIITDLQNDYRNDTVKKSILNDLEHELIYNSTNIEGLKKFINKI